MPVAKGKVEMKVHVPVKAYEYIKRRAGQRGMGQFLMDIVDCYNSQGDLAQRIIAMEENLDRLMDHLIGVHASHEVQ